jgi:glutaminyl-tRNA synthetase
MSRGVANPKPGADFIRQIVAEDTERGRYGGRVVTRFPPEPNGFMHIGHAKSVCLNFGVAKEFGGVCHLRYDDTNPEGENEAFVVGFQEDIRWLGFDWGEHLYFASDYFERMYDCAVILIEKGLAYVDSESEEEIREGRGTVTKAGTPGQYRDRTVVENLDLFRRMREGEFEGGRHVLRAKIDLESVNMLMRDPVLYRIRHASHYRQGDEWCIYPMYDYAHCLEDAFEDVTHSICTLEFENNRELYDWVLDSVGFEEPRTHQYEFARLDLAHAVLSKRRIIPLVEAGVVSGWDDPRLSTVRGIRRRGVPPEALRLFCEMIGVAKAQSVVDIGKLEYAIREVLNQAAPRVMAVLDPIKIVLTDYPDGQTEEFEAPYFPHDVPREGTRMVPFSNELFIERTDFEEDPPPGFWRLVPGGEVRLRHAYVIRCEKVVRDKTGQLVELHCTHDSESRGGKGTAGRKVKGTIQWVSAAHALTAEIRLYDHLFLEIPESDSDEDEEIVSRINPDSLRILKGAKVEPSISDDSPDTRYQFERTGYFWKDPVDGAGEELVFNRIVSLKDNWSRSAAKSDVKVPRDKSGSGKVMNKPRRPEKPTVSESREAARAVDPQLMARFERYSDDLGLTLEQADLLTTSPEVSDFFEKALAVYDEPAEVAGWLTTDVRGLLGARRLKDLTFDGEGLGQLIALVAADRLSRRAGKDVLARMIDEGGDPDQLMVEMGLEKVTDPSTLESVIEEILAAWPEKVIEYQAGKSGLIGMFVGEVMKTTNGAADPKVARELLLEKLGG